MSTDHPGENFLKMVRDGTAEHEAEPMLEREERQAFTAREFHVSRAGPKSRPWGAHFWDQNVRAGAPVLVLGQEK